MVEMKKQALLIPVAIVSFAVAIGLSALAGTGEDPSASTFLTASLIFGIAGMFVSLKCACGVVRERRPFLVICLLPLLIMLTVMVLIYGQVLVVLVD